jgi:hypothetical protein
MSEKQFNFVYVTVDKTTGKCYVGSHCTNDLNCYKTAKYLGSGIYLNNAIKKYGRKNFLKIKIRSFISCKEAREAEAAYISMFDTLVPNGYNISPKGGMQFPGGCSDETRIKISEAKKGIKIPEYIKTKMSIAQTGVKKSIPRTKEHTEKIIKNREEHGWITWNKGMKMNEDFCEKASKRQQGKPSNFKGRKHSKESIEKMKQTLANKNKEKYESKRRTDGVI